MDQLADLSSTLPHYPPPPSKGSPAAADQADEHYGQPNLAGLPDIVLMNLFKMLPVRDRGRLACTCSRLSSILQCCSFWPDVTIQLQAAIATKTMSVSFLGPKDSGMIKRYGAYFQRTTIVFPCKMISQEVYDMLSQFTQREAKMKLILQQGVSIPRAVNCSFSEPVHNVTDVIDTLSLSTSISFEFAHYHFDLFGITKKFYCNPKSARFCSMVTELVLPEQWAEQKLAELYGLSPTPTAALISNFHALQRLKLSLHNASEELLLELSDSSGRRSPLRSLVLQHVDGRKSQPEAFPQLSSAAWSKLTSACPPLTVECYFACHHMPPLSHVIKPEMPLVKLKVTCNKYTDRAQFDQVCKEHKSTLKFFCLSAGIDLGIGRTHEYLETTGWNVPV